MGNCETLIIGAGAAGLAAARELVNAGKKVLLLEARSRIGGRIYTLNDGKFSKPVELGAEFVHGHLPVTLELLEQYNIPYYKTDGEMWNMHNGKFKKGYNSFEDSNLLQQHLKELKEDVPVKEFLETHFPCERYAVLRNSAKGFVEGYDAADYAKASTLKFRDEWLAEDDWEQYCIEGGYRKLIDAMDSEFKMKGGNIQLSAIVTKIKWGRNHVEVITADNHSYTGAKVLLTVPLGVLQAEAGSEGAINFSPSINEKLEAARALGFGPAEKIVLQFSKKFWDNDLGFLLSDAHVPTWWTQLPDNANILTGWLAGTSVNEFKTKSKEEILQLALNSLAYIFEKDVAELKDLLRVWEVTQWADEPFTRGGYNYETVEASKYRKILSEPVEGTIFFAGEALYPGRETGTVEAALANGIAAAESLLTC